MQPTDPDRPPVARTFSGGVLMGLANLVPGVSGGTMILAVGLYDRFISAVAELTSLRWSRPLFLFLGVLGAGAALAILGGSGLAVHLVATHRWIMYSLFVGMALGGVPELFRRCRPLSTAVAAAALLGFGVMAALAFALREAPVDQNAWTFAAIGALAASSMILPGISGSYILLVFGMYDAVIGSLSLSELRADAAGCLRIVLPVGLGAAAGIALLSNALKAVLARFPAPSHGLLLGLLVGSVLGLWPFRVDRHPDLVDRGVRKAVTLLVEGQELVAVRARYPHVERTDAELAALAQRYAGCSAGDLKRLSQESQPVANPGLDKLAGALALVLVGFLSTWALARRGD